MKAAYYEVLGGGGLIGSNIVRYLRERGHTVFKIERHGIGKELYNIRPRKQDIVINCSSYGNHNSQTNIRKIVQANFYNVAKIVKAKKEWNGTLYNLSTSSVHLKVQTAYSLSKQLGELLVTEAGGINIRPYSVFGPGEAAHRFIPTVIRCLNTGEKMQLATEPRHDWIFVDSFVEAMFSFVPQDDKNCIEIGTGESYSNLEIVRMLEEISGKQLNFDIVEGLRSYDNTDWKCPQGVPHRPIKEALKKTYDSFRI